ncbi:cobyrinate a,c-diamide synthase [Chitiniphilus purpureus]|uniref:Cobyrinate a,c-diamide synthase n=1 Tax=Chitiniphilus purpureus TaxID=2981137 RepID=A0ABY6DI53_9NEIS|nr:cobyrinate a,c-diamide synthase [Chitiniphilus sp. CD1]UXY13908.1 cobyrinate a,c-diamide synthase [Chitiniphilus sp. CD1]
MVARHATAPALMIAAPASGSGKTTVTAALAWLHRRAGRRVKVFKCGPDFLDPLLLARASGSPVDNLDLWLVGEAQCRTMLCEAAATHDLVLIEAVMGLFDGEPSAAVLAQRLGIPVLAVIDASAMAQTFGALAHGLAHYRAGLPFHGVLANKVAGTGHAQMLQESVPPADWQGWLAAGDAWPERHLGLSLPHELPGLEQRLDELADALEGQPAAALPSPVAFAADAPPAMPRRLAGRRIAVARDAAFCFIYPANLACLTALGAELAFFSPLAHEPLPEADAVWLPGGYPELHGARLAAHPTLAAGLRAHHAAGRPIVAECGGMLALAERLIVDGETLPLWGLLPGTATLHSRLTALGLQQLDLGEGVLRGHTFHYSTLTTPLPALAHATPCRLGSAGEPVYRLGSLTASYLHLWFMSHPAAAATLFGAR